MIKSDRIRIVPQWGDTLKDRLLKAGYEIVEKGDVDDILDLPQIGEVRINNLKEYLSWSEKHEDNLVEKNESSEIYVIENTLNLLFNVKLGNLEIFRVSCSLADGGGVKGRMYMLYKGNGPIKYSFICHPGSWLSVKDESGKFRPFPKVLRRMIRRAAEIAELRLEGD